MRPWVHPAPKLPNRGAFLRRMLGSHSMRTLGLEPPPLCRLCHPPPLPCQPPCHWVPRRPCFCGPTSCLMIAIPNRPISCASSTAARADRPHAFALYGRSLGATESSTTCPLTPRTALTCPPLRMKTRTMTFRPLPRSSLALTLRISRRGRRGGPSLAGWPRRPLWRVKRHWRFPAGRRPRQRPRLQQLQWRRPRVQTLLEVGRLLARVRSQARVPARQSRLHSRRAWELSFRQIHRSLSPRRKLSVLRPRLEPLPPLSLLWLFHSRRALRASSRAYILWHGLCRTYSWPQARAVPASALAPAPSLSASGLVVGPLFLASSVRRPRPAMLSSRASPT